MLFKLTDLIPEDIFVGTSLILRRGSRFLYGTRPTKQLGSHRVLELTGIGGGLEAEDATISAGALREAQEEIGCSVRLIPCQETLIVRNETDTQRTRLDGPEQPAAVVFRNYRTPPHQPWHETHADKTCVVVFMAELEGQPWPSSELPWLIWLTAEQILATARADVPLGRLLNEGADLVLGNSDPPPEDCWVRMTDSQEALALALGDDLWAFYHSRG